jgi:hypothetical protein
VARANGEADAKLKLADADRQAAILNAQGSAEAIRLEGESRANVLRLNAEVLRSNASVVELVKADRWNGILSQTLLDGTGVTPSRATAAGQCGRGEMTPTANRCTMTDRPICFADRRKRLPVWPN